MAAAAALSPVTVVAAAAVVGPSRPSLGRARPVKYINSFGGLKANNHVAALGLPICSEQSFAKIVSSLKQQSRRGGGALTSTCSAAITEIFKIAAIIPGLVLVGVAIGFVLLRIEASVEEAE